MPNKADQLNNSGDNLVDNNALDLLMVINKHHTELELFLKVIEGEYNNVMTPEQLTLLT